ncbi:MAG: HD domain-containing protein [Chloroflexota bacterium]|nr:HD domain-containing protein [Chloroflexota bacterium]
MLDLRDWLLRLVADTLAREGSVDGTHDIDHIARTMALAETLHTREGGDLPTILAAVALHDIGQERERRDGGDHALIGAEMAAELLTDTQFPQAAIPAVQRAIREHRTTGAIRPLPMEGRIVYDADKLDSLGAVGIARLYCITGLLGQRVYARTPDDLPRPTDPAVIRQLRKSRDYSSSIEFELLLADLPDQLLTPTGRALARERHDYMRAFFTRLRQEVEGQF